MHYHAVAILSGDRRKTLANRSEEQVFSEVVLPFVANGVITAKWGAKTQTYQVLELRVYRTKKVWHKPSGPLDEFIKGQKNLFPRFETRAQKVLGKGKMRVFVIMPIQGEKHGDQEDQRVYREYDERFEAIEKVVGDFDCVAIRIDKEHPIEDLVTRIKKEIYDAAFIIADLTDERPSCYFESGYAEALPRSIIYVASKNSVLKPGTPTRVHFDIHMERELLHQPQGTARQVAGCDPEEQGKAAQGPRRGRITNGSGRPTSESPGEYEQR